MAAGQVCAKHPAHIDLNADRLMHAGRPCLLPNMQGPRCWSSVVSRRRGSTKTITAPRPLCSYGTKCYRSQSLMPRAPVRGARKP